MEFALPISKNSEEDFGTSLIDKLGTITPIFFVICAVINFSTLLKISYYYVSFVKKINFKGDNGFKISKRLR